MSARSGTPGRTQRNVAQSTAGQQRSIPSLSTNTPTASAAMSPVTKTTPTSQIIPTTQPIVVTTTGVNYPAKAWHRWVLRFLFAIPYAVLAIFATLPQVHLAVATPNEIFLDSVSHLPDTFTLTDLTQFFPPLSTGAALLFPSALGLGLCGAALAGWFLTELLRVLHLSGLRLSHTVLGLAAIGFNPVFAFLAVYDIRAFAATLFFGIALIDTFRFVSRRDTRAGFRAGIFLLLASLSGWSGLLLTVLAGVSAPFLLQAHVGRVWPRISNTVVLLLPTAGSFGAILFLSLLFNTDPLLLLDQALNYNPAMWSLFVRLFTTPTGFITLLPFIFFAALSIALRRPATLILDALLLVMIILGKVLGLIPPTTTGQTFLVTFMLGVALAVEVGRIKVRGIVWIYWVVLCIASWALVYVVPDLSSYWHSILG